MKFVVIDGADHTLAENQEEYETIKVRKGSTLLEYSDGSTREVPTMTLALELDPLEIAQVVINKRIYLTVLGGSWPPVSLHTEDPILAYLPKGNA